MQPGFGPIDESDHRLPDADVSHISRKWLDLPYASLSGSQKLDVYLPERGSGPFPVVLTIHGGAFASGDKRSIEITPYLQGLGRGYAVVGINYRLSGEAVFPAGLQDLKAAIRWLRTHARKYHLDPGRFAACGSSAGGNYAAMLCLTAGVTEFDDPRLGDTRQPCSVQAGVDWYGPTDFLKMDQELAESGLGPCDHNEAISPESRYLGARITEVPDTVKKANPITYVHRDMPPLLIQHGRLDHLVPVQQSIIFARELKEKAGPRGFEFEILENADHADPLFETRENMQRVFSFLDRHLK